MPQLELLKKEINPPSLRDYQIKFIEDIYEHIRKGETRILGVSGTGSGKTVMAAKIVADAVAQHQKVLFIVHLDVLVGQTYEKFSAFGIGCGFIKAGWQENQDALVQIASAQTLPRRSWWKEHFVPDLIICDEAHETSWITVVSDLLERYEDSVVIGLTATPYRLSKKQGVGDKYNVLVSAPTPGELMQQGYLVFPVYYGLKSPDLSTIRTIGGDFAEDGLSNVMNDSEVLQSMLENWKRLASDRKTIAFAVNVAHSKAIAQTFLKAGIAAEQLDGSTPVHVRQQMFRRLASGETQVLSSCQALQIGFDCPPTDCVLMCRPTKSKSIYFQQLGRGLRPFPGKKDCLVLDQSGNVKRFGFVEDVKRFRLTHGKDSDGEAPMKECPGCQRLLYTFIMECPGCGYEFPRKEAPKPVGLMQQLSRKPSPVPPPPVPSLLITNKEIEDKKKKELVRQCLKKVWQYKMKPGWVYFQVKDKFGNTSIPKDFFLHAIFGDRPLDTHKSTYLQFLCEKLEGHPEQITKYYSWEFGEPIPPEKLQAIG